MSSDTALDAVERNLRSARNILLTINVICAFLFILVFEMVFGWQLFRGSGSEKVFAENLSRLALSEHAQTEFEQDIRDLAGKHCRIIISRHHGSAQEELKLSIYEGNPDRLRSLLDHCISKDSVWIQKEYLRLFLADVDQLITLYAEAAKQKLQKVLRNENASTDTERLTDTVAAGLRNIATALLGRSESSNDEQQAAVVNTDSMSSNSKRIGISCADVLLRTQHPEISYCLQQIQDRYDVNEETRGRRKGRREIAFPIVGTPIQVEDVSIPVVVFLVLLTYWLYTSVIKACDSARVYLSHSSLKSIDVHSKVDELLSNLQFIRRGHQHTPHPEPPIGVVLLHLSPYLVAISGVLAHLHENLIINYQYHSSEFVFSSSIVLVLCYTSLLAVAAAALLANLAWSLTRQIFCLYGNLLRKSKQAEPGSRGAAGDENKGDSDEQRMWLNDLGSINMTKLKPTFCYIMIAPFVVFGSYSAIVYSSEYFTSGYFLPFADLLVYILILVVYGVVAVWLARRSEDVIAGDNQTTDNVRLIRLGCPLKCVFAAVFFGLPVLMIVYLVRGGLLESLQGGIRFDSWLPGLLSATSILAIGVLAFSGTMMFENAREFVKAKLGINPIKNGRGDGI